MWCAYFITCAENTVSKLSPLTRSKAAKNALSKNVKPIHMLEIRFRRNRSFQTMFDSLFAPAFRLIGWDSALMLLVNGRSRSCSQSLAQLIIM